MALERHPNHLSADVAAGVEAATEALMIVWGRSSERLHPKVSSSQLRALLVVEQHRAINLGGLAEELGAIPSSASRLCDRLQAAGLLTRSSGPTDRREVSLRLTKDGRRLLTELRSSRRAELARVLAVMSPEACSALLTGLDAFGIAAVEAGLRRGAPD